MLHGARLGGVGGGVARGAGILIDQHYGDAAPAELVGKHQPEGAAADDQDRGFAGKRDLPSLLQGVVRWGCRTRRAIGASLGDRSSPKERCLSIGHGRDTPATTDSLLRSTERDAV